MSAAATQHPATSRAAVSASVYRQQARRLRYQHRHDPATLHLSLRALVARRDATAAEESKPASPAPRRPVAGNSVGRDELPLGRGAAPVRPQGRSALRVAVTRVDLPRPQEPPVPPAPPSPTVDPLATILQATPEAMNEFATHVRAALSDGILGFADRSALFSQAAELGIDRFEANLIIAAVERRQPAGPRHAAGSRGSAGRSGAGAAVGAALLVQGLIALAAWFFYVA